MIIFRGSEGVDGEHRRSCRIIICAAGGEAFFDTDVKSLDFHYNAHRAAHGDVAQSSAHDDDASGIGATYGHLRQVALVGCRERDKGTSKEQFFDRACIMRPGGNGNYGRRDYYEDYVKFYAIEERHEIVRSCCRVAPSVRPLPEREFWDRSHTGCDRSSEGAMNILRSLGTSETLMTLYILLTLM